MPNDIRPDTCPYCGAPYKIVYGGCRDACRISVALARIVKAAALADPGEQLEAENKEDR